MKAMEGENGDVYGSTLNLNRKKINIIINYILEQVSVLSVKELCFRDCEGYIFFMASVEMEKMSVM